MSQTFSQKELEHCGPLVDLNHDRDVVVLRRRNTKEMSCINRNSYDQFLMAEVLEKVGCIPPYLQRMSGNLVKFLLDSCPNKSEMAKVNDAMTEYFHGHKTSGKIPPPCDEIMNSNVNFVMKDFSTKESSDLFRNQINQLSNMGFREGRRQIRR